MCIAIASKTITAANPTIELFRLFSQENLTIVIRMLNMDHTNNLGFLFALCCN